MSGMLRRGAVIGGLVWLVSVPALAQTVEVETRSDDWTSACAVWGEGAGWSGSGDNPAAGDEFTVEELCAASRQARVATLTWPWGTGDDGWYGRYDCVWEERSDTDPETGETFTWLGPRCERVDERMGPIAPGTLTHDGDTYDVHGEVAGCAADFRITSFAPGEDEWPEGEPSWHPPVYRYGRGEWEWGSSTDIVGTACGVTLENPSAYGSIGSGHSEDGVGITTP